MVLKYSLLLDAEATILSHRLHQSLLDTVHRNHVNLLVHDYSIRYAYKQKQKNIISNGNFCDYLRCLVPTACCYIHRHMIASNSLQMSFFSNNLSKSNPLISIGYICLNILKSLIKQKKQMPKDKYLKL